MYCTYIVHTGIWRVIVWGQVYYVLTPSQEANSFAFFIAITCLLGIEPSSEFEGRLRLIFLSAPQLSFYSKQFEHHNFLCDKRARPLEKGTQEILSVKREHSNSESLWILRLTLCPERRDYAEDDTSRFNANSYIFCRLDGCHWAPNSESRASRAAREGTGWIMFIYGELMLQGWAMFALDWNKSVASGHEECSEATSSVCDACSSDLFWQIWKKCLFCLETGNQ